jgi:2-dehydro-3-deoxyphosphooctonate aldolase (KDO 8-P synthase)
MIETMKQVAAGKFFLIAGPCVVESEVVCLRVAETVTEICQKHSVPYIFKASYKKANRLSGSSFTGLGIDEGLRILQKVKERLGLPVLTDIHETTEIPTVAEVADVLQIPAMLCRQTDLVVAASQTGKWVNIKKGQFLAPEDMQFIAAKVNSSKVMLTERGTTFGYRNLVVDFRSLLIMKATGHKIVFDATHSLQLPGGDGGKSGGQPEFIIPFAKAAMAVGIDGLFVETHPEPSQAKSDGASMLPLAQMNDLVTSVLRIKEAAV